MANYDYGLRGPWDSDPQSFGDRRRRIPPGDPRGRSWGLPTHRVTARYNMDYIRPGGESYPRNPHRFGGDARGRIEDERAYRRPYITRGGTWTGKGATPRPGYDRPDYGPAYGGKYPDEI